MTVVADVNAVVTKGAFAKILKVSPGRVSQYIAEGKISGPALIGEGRRAKIHVATAREQLRRHLDIGQMLGNGLETCLMQEPSQSVSAPSMPADDGQPDPRRETVEDKLKRQRLFQEEIRSRKAAADEEEQHGRFTITDEVRAANTKIAVKMMQTFEGALPNMAVAIASKFELPVRDVLHHLRAEFVAMRTKAAEKNRNKAEAMPETTETEIVTEDKADATA
ncbi:hypothetical protein LP7551_02080 [Roseibium album]|nr:hypothetical protein LP7551_02080 [Roseibium album]